MCFQVFNHLYVSGVYVYLKMSLSGFEGELNIILHYVNPIPKILAFFYIICTRFSVL